MHNTRLVCVIALTVTVNASESGNGRLDIIVNGGAVPCEVENSGARKFLATFVPESDELHVVRVFFNDVEVPG